VVPLVSKTIHNDSAVHAEHGGPDSRAAYSSTCMKCYEVRTDPAIRCGGMLGSAHGRRGTINRVRSGRVRRYEDAAVTTACEPNCSRGVECEPWRASTGGARGT